MLTFVIVLMLWVLLVVSMIMYSRRTASYPPRLEWILFLGFTIYIISWLSTSVDTKLLKEVKACHSSHYDTQKDISFYLSDDKFIGVEYLLYAKDNALCENDRKIDEEFLGRVFREAKDREALRHLKEKIKNSDEHNSSR